MANPKFEATDRITNYTWAELPHIPSDHAHLSTRLRVENSVLEYKRTEFIIGRTILAQVGIWKFQFKNISQSMINSLQTFFEKSYFYYYPDGDVNSYFIVYVSDTAFRPILQSNGNFDLVLTCREYGASGTQSSSSLSYSSSSSQIPSGDLYSTDATYDIISQHSGFSATILSTFPTPASIPIGLGYDGTNLLSTDNATDKIYKHSGKSGTILDSGASPGGVPRAPSGITLDYSDNYISLEGSSDKIYIHSGTDFTAVTDSYSTPASGPRDICWAGGNLASCDNEGPVQSGTIYIHSGSTSAILYTFASPYTENADPLCLAFDGINLITGTSSNRVYKHSGVTSTIQGSFLSTANSLIGIADTGSINSR